ncbi:MAG TPA: hypothetical protein PKC21_09245 [Oligoflexia bacterium]|nr:hypothetical protein [Oligoflexia bacterium]HMR25523.1 hypothetical protein [Oligoflexia bacterium]
MKTQSLMLKCLKRIFLLGITFSLCSCLKVDAPNKPLAVESFQGDMRIEFALKELHAGIHGVNFGFFTTNKGGDQMVISQVPNNHFEIIPEDLFKTMLEVTVQSDNKESTLLYDMAASYDLHVLATPEIVIEKGLIRPPDFAGLLGDVEGNVITITGFESTNGTTPKTGCNVRGVIERSGNTMMTTEPIEIYCDVAQLVNFFGEAPLAILFNEETGERILDQENVVLWRIQFHFNQPLSVT